MSSLICEIPSDVKTPPYFVVDLDQPAISRWNHIIVLYIDQLHDVEKRIDSMVNQMIGSWTAPLLEKVVTTIMGGITRLGLVFYGEELKGFSKATGISLGRLVLIQFVYECFACCTSIVCRDPVTNIPLHIRTMDWGLDFLKSLTIDVDFQRKGQSVLKATTWIGYVGILTGIRMGKGYSVSVNYRRTTDGTFRNNLKTALSSGWPIGFLVREVLESTNDYTIAVEQLAQSLIIAPCYLIICGTSENHDPGTLITRKQNSEELRWTLVNNGTIVQTNIDHWSMNQDEDVMFSTDRRSTARRLLKEMTVINEDALWKLISKAPIMDSITIYGTFMCPEYGTYHTRLPERGQGFTSKKNPEFRLTNAITEETSRHSPLQTYSCVKCYRDFHLEENPRGHCVHNGTWHWKYEDCSYLKCGFQLAKQVAIGSAHWSCCYSLDRNSNTCSNSHPHTFFKTN